MLELALLDSKMNQYKPSMLASSAIYTAKEVLNQCRRSQSQQALWTEDLVKNTGYSRRDLQSCSDNMY